MVISRSLLKDFRVKCINLENGFLVFCFVLAKLLLIPRTIDLNIALCRYSSGQSTLGGAIGILRLVRLLLVVSTLMPQSCGKGLI